jgi:Zn finger protein HypA/HybF involved in hydrogenase expression
MQFGDANAKWMFARSRPIVECEACGTRLYVPEWSEYVEPGRIRYLWHCEDCGASFETVSTFEAA